MKKVGEYQEGGRIRGQIPAEIIEDGKTGRLYPAGDSQALSEVIAELLNDDSKRIELSIAAKEWIIAHRTWQSVIEPMYQNYQNLVKEVYS
jgi:glycosyltransferase involved in cell wall biosynthesis